jgi:hypothetical protein
VITTIAPVTVPTTDEFIREFQAIPSLNQERPLKPGRLEALRREWDAGRFYSPTWARTFVRALGRDVRLNGQHTSHLLLERPVAERPPVVLHRFECDTATEASELFSTYDSRDSVRSATDVARATFAMCGGEIAAPARLATALVAAVGMARQADLEWEAGKPVLGESRRAGSLAERASAAVGETAFLKWVTESFPARDARTSRAPVLAAMYLTHRVDPAAATAFWREVGDGTGPSPTSPSRVLREYLLAAKLGVSARSGGRSASAREMTFKALRAWNAYRANQSLERINYRDTAMLPKPV